MRFHCIENMGRFNQLCPPPPSLPPQTLSEMSYHAGTKAFMRIYVICVEVGVREKSFSC